MNITGLYRVQVSAKVRFLPQRFNTLVKSYLAMPSQGVIANFLSFRCQEIGLSLSFFLSHKHFNSVETDFVASHTPYIAKFNARISRQSAEVKFLKIENY